MSECLAVEKAYGRRYAQWQEDLGAGSAEAMCVLAWIIWRPRHPLHRHPRRHRGFRPAGDAQLDRGVGGGRS